MNVKKLNEMKVFLKEVKSYSLENNYLNKDDLGNIVPNMEHLESKIIEIYMELALFLALVDKNEEEQYYKDMNKTFDDVYNDFKNMQDTFKKLK